MGHKGPHRTGTGSHSVGCIWRRCVVLSKSAVTLAVTDTSHSIAYNEAITAGAAVFGGSGGTGSGGGGGGGGGRLGSPVAAGLRAAGRASRHA